MSSQIFKKEIDKNIIFQLLDKLCIKNDKFYTFNNNSYNILNCDNELPPVVSNNNFI